MDKQVSSTCKSAWYKIHQIGKIRPYLNIEESKSVINSFVTSKLDQNNSLLLGVADEQISRLQKIQNASAKIICQKKKYDHVTPLLKDLHWLPVKHRITFKVLLFTYKALNGEAPSYLSDMLQKHKTKDGNRSGDDPLLLHIPRTKNLYGDAAFSVGAPRLWNDLPLSIRSSASTAIFKKNLKTYLFKQYFGAC